MTEVTHDERTVTTDAREIHILHEASRNPTATFEEIADSLDFPTGYKDATPEEVEEVVAQKKRPERFIETDDIPPVSESDRVRTIFEDNPDVLETALEGGWGYSNEVVEAVEDRWGEEFSAAPAVVSSIKGDFEEEQEESIEEAEEVEEASTSPGRVKAVITADGYLDDVADGLDDETLEAIRDATEEVYGIAHRPTEGTVRQAVADLREEGRLPSLAEDISGSGPDTSIAYICERCGYTHEDIGRVKTHLTETEDAAHKDRNAKADAHLISTTLGDQSDIEEPPEQETEDGFEILWAIYNNPGARQKDIAEMLDTSTGTISSRLRDLGIDWEDRQEQVEDVFDTWFSDDDTGTPDEAGVMTASPDDWDGNGHETEETVTKEVGGNSYTGPFSGIDTTSGRGTTHLSEVDVSTETTATLELTADEVFEIINGTTGPVARRIYRKALATFTEEDLEG